jgi:hypothetical protein
MAKKYVYQKGSSGVSDFVYVDLLPDVKRVSQFNMNVIIALLFAVVATYFLVFIPFRAATEEFELANGKNNDLHHRLELKQQELILHEINENAIIFQNDIDQLEVYKLDFNDLLDDVNGLVEVRSGDIREISYSAENSILTVRVQLSSFFTFNHLEGDFINLGWVTTAEYTDPEAEGAYYVAVFTLEVTPDVE